MKDTYFKHLRLSCSGTNIALLLIHLITLCIFYRLKIHVMVGINLLSISLYTIAFILIFNSHIISYFRLIYAQALIYMTFATMMLGWLYGFQLYSYGIIPIIFFSGYMNHNMYNAPRRKVHIETFSMTLIAILIYIFCIGYTYFFEPVYHIKNTHIRMTIVLSNSLIVFLFIIYYMTVYTHRVIFTEKRILEKAERDELTGMHNRYYMNHYIENILAQTKNKDSANNTMLFAAISDIDDFKLINDTYGHLCGDYILKKVAHIAEGICSDYQENSDNDQFEVCRWGGEEFLFVSSIIDDDQKQHDFLENVRNTIEHTTFIYQHNQIPVTITIGNAKYSSKSSIDKWIEQADQNLYTGKENGKNCVSM